MKKLRELSQELLKNKKVLVRFDLNVPLADDGTVHENDADRIRKSQATLDYLQNAGARVIIISHIGRDPHESLKPIAQYMQIPLLPLSGITDELLGNHQVVMLENLRSDPREESNELSFAQELASYAELYVNDAFAVSHRAHASIVALPQLLPAYAGFQLEAEVENLNKALSPQTPSILIMGGAKFETKLPVIKKLLPSVDRVLIGGALANNFFKEKGFEIGKSLVDDTAVLGELVNDSKIILPDQVVVQSDSEYDNSSPGKNITEVLSSDRIVDISIPEVAKDFIMSAQTIIWNGPMGNYENGFTEGTKELIQVISTSEGFSMVGGGDSIALIESLGIENRFGFLSTGGGAMLEYFAQGTLPGIEALKQNSLE